MSRKCSEDAIAEAGQAPSVGSNPKVILVAGEKGGYRFIAQAGGSGIVDGKAKTVEPCQSFFRADPEIAVMRLGHGKNRVLRQALSGLPTLVNVARERPVWIKAGLQWDSPCQQDAGAGRNGPA